MSIVSNNVRNYFKLDLLLARSCGILRQVFKRRYSLFNGGQLWDDTQVCGTTYVTNAASKNTIKNLTKPQKASVSNGDSHEWDLSLLTALLLNADRPTTLTAPQIQQIDQEDQMLTQLKNTRNELAHNAFKSASDAEFNRLWTSLSFILVALGDDNNELDKLKDVDVFAARTQTINEENVKEAKRLNSLGTQAHKEGKFDEAISLFTKATVLASVADCDRAIFFSNMSSSRLGLYEQQSKQWHRFEFADASDPRYRALQDAKQARNLWSTWWKGHFRVGKVHTALNEHEKAINSFERALALAPTNSDIKKALDESRSMQCRELSQQHMDPRGRLGTIPEQLNELKEKFGIDPEEVRKGRELAGILDPAQADVVKGHKYLHGDNDVKQDYEQAARYFAKAASQGNPEAMYNLAWMTDRGLGVKKDHTAALKLLEQAVAQPAQLPGFPNIPNPGVAEAEHLLGVRYAEGISVDKDPVTAVYWYERAMNHENAEAPNNLGIMYRDGIAVERNVKKANQLFQLSARRGDSGAMLNLAEMLLQDHDFEMAKTWFDRACEAGNITAQINRDTFHKIVAQQQHLVHRCPSEAIKIFDKVQDIANSLQTSKTSSGVAKNSSLLDYEMLNEYANRGSITARRLCNALEHFAEAFEILMQVTPLTEEQENTFVHELSQCFRIEHIVAMFPGVESRQKAKIIVERVLRRCDTETNTVISQLDEDARVCYVTLQFDSRELTLQFLNVCKKKYPKVSHFYETSTHVHGFSERYEESLYDANQGLEIDPNNCTLLCDKAVALRLIATDMGEAIKAYEQFLLVAPKDHRKVPDAYYSMAGCYLARKKSHDSMQSVDKFYHQGEEAEKLQLPCFLPYVSSSKTFLKNLVYSESLLNTKLNPTSSRKSRLTDPHRIEVITHHREWQNMMMLQAGNNRFDILKPTTCKPRLQQQPTKSLTELKPITLREMNPTKDHIYNGYVLSVTIIERASSWIPSIHIVIEDEHFDCERMHIYNFPEGQGERFIDKVFIIGSKMHIINPYLRIGVNDMKSTIRVDDFSSIIMQNESERVMNMCRCCGEANALHVCSKCKEARYCSRECQTMDWKLYKHKQICKSQ